MIFYTGPKLAEKSAIFRYLHFLVTSFRLESFRSWQAAGEPNPFVGKTYRAVRTEQKEFVDIFEDVLAPQNHR